MCNAIKYLFADKLHKINVYPLNNKCFLNLLLKMYIIFFSTFHIEKGRRALLNFLIFNIMTRYTVQSLKNVLLCRFEENSWTETYDWR